MIKSLKKLTIFVLAGLFSLSAIAVSDQTRSEIEARIKPVGDVCVQGDAACGSAQAASSGARSGEDVYNAACMACHTTGAAGAPRLGQAAEWTDRIAKGVDALYDSSINGLSGTGMIAKGGCMNCSDEEVSAAVDYMLENSQ